MGEIEQEKFDLENPGPFIKKRREFFKLSQEELAFLVGVKQAHISIIENENKKPSIEVLKKILYVLNSEIHVNCNNELKTDVKNMYEIYKKEMKTIDQAKKRLEELRDKHIIEGGNPES